MENVLFTRSSTPSDEPIVDGQLIFDTSGTGKMYLDNGTDRLEMGGAMNVDSTLSKTSTNPIQNKAVAGVMLENLTDIDTVTTSGFLTDALATKELHTEVNEINNNLTANSQPFRYAYQDGKYGYIAKVEGADTFFPFRTTYSSENPRVEGSSEVTVSNIQWVGSFGVSVVLNLKPEDTCISFTTNMAMTVNIDGVSRSHAAGKTVEYRLSGNRTFTASLGGATQGDKDLIYSYKIW